MIIVRFMGGLGNQMFQYCLYKNLELLGKDVYADLSWFEINSNEREFSLGQFGINLELADKNKSDAYSDFKKKFFARLRRKLFGIKRTYVREKLDNYFRFSEEILNLDNVYLDGYWQNLGYFEKNRDIITSNFDFERIGINGDNQQYLSNILSCEAVAIHVRGGDYLSEENRKIYGNICTKEYYCSAINWIKATVINPVFFVFSNSQEYAKTVLPDENYIFVKGNSEKAALEEMKLMKNCKHFIIANSTFSWWAAFLSKSSEKIVIAPSRWTNDVNNSEIVPNGWIRIEN